MSPNIDNIYIYISFEAFFSTGIDLELLPQNKVPFGSNQDLKFCLYRRTCQFFWRRNLANLVSSCSEFHEDSKTVNIGQRSSWSWPKNDREAHRPIAPSVVVGPRHLSSGRETTNVHLSSPPRAAEPARAQV